MDLARYIVDAVVLEGRSYGEVAGAHGVSKSWMAKLVWRFKAGGYEAIDPRSRAAKRIPNRTPPEIEDQIVALRKQLADAGRAIKIGTGVRARRDRIDRDGKVNLRYRTKLHHIGVGKAHKRKAVIMLIDGLDTGCSTKAVKCYAD